MFSFHKPKVYRSSTGCCICKAKSSSSRFTDSKKYEDDFFKCFLLAERRTGEICNACVLLVKRWKKLPVASDRNWSHVVDARAGPGIKSLTKFKTSKNKKKTKEAPEKFEKILKKKHLYSKDGDREQSPAMSDDTEEDMGGTGSKGSSRAGSPADSEADREMDVSSFIDLTYFKRKNVCCGVIFVGMMGEVLIEPSLLKPCIGCLARQQRQRIAAAAKSLQAVASSSPSHSSASASPSHSSASTSPAHSVESGTEGGKPTSGKGFSDSSSDSGYDDFNQALISESKMKCQTLLDKPVKVQMPKPETVLPATVPLRLTNLGGTKMPIKLLGKSVALLSSAKLSLSNGTSRPDTVLAVRPPPQRQSLAN